MGACRTHAGGGCLCNATAVHSTQAEEERIDPLTNSISGAAGFAGPHRVDHAEGRAGDVRRDACDVGVGGGGGIFAVAAALDALAGALRIRTALFHHRGERNGSNARG